MCARSGSQRAVDPIAEQIGGQVGRIDVLFANAGGGDGLTTISDLRPESFDRVFGINVRGTVFTVQKMLPLMPDGSSIVRQPAVRRRR